MESVKPEERNDYEILDGKKIPMRYWNPRLSSKDIAVISLAITTFIVEVECQYPQTKLDMREAFEKILFRNLIPE